MCIIYRVLDSHDQPISEYLDPMRAERMAESLNESHLKYDASRWHVESYETEPELRRA